MCGFIGVHSNDLLTNEKIEGKLRNLLRHRGPDHSSLLKDGKFLFVHNRLSIIDLNDEANQPFISPETGSVLLFNGEIYNYQQLKQKYNTISWKTNSDTEVIVRLYDLLGEKFVSELNGIFAFVIFDKKNNKLMFYRDRLGVKPLHYKISGKNIYFSSEMKGILCFLKEYTLNYKAIYDYLEFGLMCHNEQTFIDDIYSVLPGSYLKINLTDGKNTKHIYWDVDDADLSSKSEDEIYEEALSLLQDSVRLNLVSDVEIGLSLSSGLDSTLLLYLLKEQGADSLRSFTFGYGEDEYDEVRRVRQNNLLSLHDHHPIYLSSRDMLDVFKEAVYYFEVPIGGLGALSAYHMMKSVKAAGIKVMLVGEGADEAFGGYQYYYPAFFKDIEHNRDLLDKELQNYSKAHNNDVIYGSEEYKKMIRSTSNYGVMAPDGTSLESTYCSHELFEMVKGQNKKRGCNENRKFTSMLKTIMYKDLKEKKLPKLLFFQDRQAMASSVETRVPYLDHRLIELMYSVPAHYKIRDGRTKYLARKILREHFDAVLNTDVKHYVATPQREWLKGDLFNDVMDVLKDGSLVQSRLVQFDKFLSDYRRYRKEKQLGNSFFVWKMLNLEFLLDSFSAMKMSS